MSEIFGIPMSSIMVVLLVLLAICLFSVAWVAWRRPVIFKMGVRNIPRRKAQTVLIVIGLMLSTLIIAAALGTGDTIDYSATLETYRSLGPTDELVVASKQEDAEGAIGTAINERARLPQEMLQRIETHFQDTGLVDGLMPVLIEQVPVALIEGPAPAAGANIMQLFQQGRIVQAEPAVYVVGIDPARVPQFGGLADVDGNSIDFAALADTETVISQELADKLGAQPGDTIGFTFQNRPYFLTVQAVAKDSPLSGRFDPTTPGMAVKLDWLQQQTGQEGLLTAVAVSNTGDLRTGMALTDRVTDELKTLLAGEPVGVDTIKKDLIDQAKLFASIFTTFFIVFGLFSIAVGILLIVLIFTMLAAERRPEIGMARAIGAQRRQIVQQFVAEGAGYAIAAGLVGVVLGVGAAYAIGLGIAPLFGDFLDIEPHVTLRSMVVAYCLGVVITFIAVVGASWKVSRLNIVAAIRDIPDVSSPKRKLRTIVWSALLLLIGAGATLAGASAKSAFPFYLGMSLLPFGVALLLRFFGAPSRPVFSVVGLYIVVLWLLPDSVSTKLFGELNGDIEMFFLSGIMMVTGATIVIVQNLDWLLAALSAIGGIFRSKLPAVRTAVAFPGAAKGRTGMTIAMFSLIVFSLVMFATINENFVNIFLGDEANAGWDIRADQAQTNPIGDTSTFLALLKERGVDPTSFVEAAGQATTNYQVNMRRPGQKSWRSYLVRGMDEGFLKETTWAFSQRARGYEDDAAIVQALLTEPDAVVVDQSALASQGGFGADPNAFRLDDPDGEGPERALTSSDKTFEPITVEIQRSDGTIATVRVIGVIDAKLGTLFGMFGRDDVIRAILPQPAFTSYYLRVKDESQADREAKAIEQALLINGVQATSIADELEKQQRQNSAFLYIIQGFMGLGLIVGIAAVGVIAFRSVVERRQQIGVLRAIGFQQSMVSLSFLIETLFVVGLGVLSGTGLGLVLARNLFSSDDFSPTGSVNFVIPWPMVAAILIVATTAALVMTVIPARQAARLAPAEALRYE